MQRSSFFSTMASFLALVLVLALAPVTVLAQGETFIGMDTIEVFEATAPGIIIDDDFDSIVNDINGDPIEPVFNDDRNDAGRYFELQNPLQLAWGEISAPVSEDSDMPGLFSRGFVSFVEGLFRVGRNTPSSRESLVLELNNPLLRQLEGFAYSFRRGSRQTVSFYDGDTLIEEFTLDDNNFPGFLETRRPSGSVVDPSAFSFAWINTDGRNVTRIEIAIPPGVVRLELSSMRFAFAEVLDAPVDPPVLTCFEQLTDVRLGVEALLETAESDDAAFLNAAASCIEWTQNDNFWVQPSSNRLTAYGSSVFIGATYTILYLERVEDPQADVLIDQLLDVLDCIVENEIQYAIENGGRESFIERAADFAELAVIIDDDFDNQVVSSLAFKLAWLHAFYATY